MTAVVTTRNRLGMLRRALGSILGQEDVPVRAVVVDEGSSDGTQEFLAALDDPRVQVVRNDPPLGLPAARNAGAAVTDSEWIAVCDDDDLWSPTKLRAQFEALANRPDARWAVAGTISVDESGRIVGYRDLLADGNILGQLLVNNVIPGVSGLMYQRSLFEEVGAFDPELRASEDWDMEIRLAAAAPVASAHGPHIAYRVAAGSMSNDTDRMRHSFDIVRHRYAELARSEGVAFDLLAYEEYLAHHQIRARQRVPAARTYAGLAWRQKDLRHAVRATTALVAPAWMDRKGDERGAARVPQAWVDEFRQWYPRVPVLGVTPPVPSTD